MGVPASWLNCFDGWGFFVLASMALGMGAMRVPSPAAGMITITFIAGCKYTRRQRESSNQVLIAGEGTSFYRKERREKSAKVAKKFLREMLSTSTLAYVPCFVSRPLGAGTEVGPGPATGIGGATGTGTDCRE